MIDFEHLIITCYFIIVLILINKTPNKTINYKENIITDNINVNIDDENEQQNTDCQCFDGIKKYFGLI